MASKRRTSEEVMQDAAAKFQRDMAKLGLGVSISVPGHEPVAVTTWCPSCNHVATGKVTTCPECKAAISDG